VNPKHKSNEVDIASDSVLICTLFDRNYLPAGMAMIESVLEASGSHFHFLVLALDDDTFDFLTSLKREEITPLKLTEFTDDLLAQLRQQRTWREFCWTLPAYMLESALNSTLKFSFVAYVDSDCFFFSDFSQLVKELKADESVLIHAHRFPEVKKHMEYESGIYNVGVILGRANANFLKVVAKWKEDVIAECKLDPAAGKCGDQTYLNDWPALFKYVKIAESHGIGAGPWNIESSKYSCSNRKVFVNGKKLVFYHFSRFKPIYISKHVNFCAAALGYAVPNIVKTEVYRIYLREYSKEYMKVQKYFGRRFPEKLSFQSLAPALKQKQVVAYLDLRFNLVGRRMK
jgi:hypothetical protein